MSTTYTLVQRHKCRGIRTWYIRTCCNGKESYKSTKTSKKIDAMKIFTEYVDRKGKMQKDLSELNIKDSVDEYLRIKANSVNSATTLSSYRKGCKALLAWCEKNGYSAMGDINTKVAQDYCNYLASYMKPTSVSCRMQVAGAVYNEIIRIYDLVARNPFENVKKPRYEIKLADFWTMEQCDVLIANALNKWYAALWGLMAYAGLRFSEARNIQVENVMGGRIVVRNGKGGRDAVVPVCEKLQKLLDAVVEGRTEGSLFGTNLAGKNDKSIEQLQRAAQRSGRTDFGRIYNHKFRHSFASELLRKGVNVKAVQVLGRWHRADIMLKHYAGVMDAELENAVNLL